MIWERLIELKDDMVSILDSQCNEYYEPGMERFNNPNYGWVNRTWKNESVRRAHIDVVDVRDTKKLWMMHVCIFPELDNGGPIYGFDIIAGQKKVTGAFHDFSPLLKKDHELTQWFVNEVKDFKPTKERELPDWAKAIFSDGMIAASNVQDIDELNEICEIALNNLQSYLDTIGKYSGDSNKQDVIQAQNYYCEHQRMNPHTPRVMKSLGLPEEDIEIFHNNNLFPHIALENV